MGEARSYNRGMSETEELAAEQATAVAALADPRSLVAFAGVRTPAVFSNAPDELHALAEGAGVYDLGSLTRFRITGEDRVRWLNGMVTNTVRDLLPGMLNYSFLLNAQGRIQGDGEVYALPDSLLFATDRAQAPRLQAQLDRFIIMDDVELTPEPGTTALGLAGPLVPGILEKAGLPQPVPGRFAEVNDLLLAQTLPGRWVVWMPEGEAIAWWRKLVDVGAMPCGSDAAQTLRVLSGVPRYGADIHDKLLPQETGQLRALNFSKGCYLGQEIVERIRSRATVHRALRVFAIDGTRPTLPARLFAEGKPETAIGELTSITPVETRWGVLALGTVRTEVADVPLTYDGGTAHALPHALLATA